MEKDLVNIEEAGFTPEDLENAGVELEETTEETGTQETATDEPSTMMRLKVMRMMRK